MINYLCIIQARLESTRLPNKVMQMVGDRTMLKRVWDAAKGSWANKVVVAWPERYPDLDQNNVLERFKRISNEFPCKYIIRLTSDCPLITSEDINIAMTCFIYPYYSNRKDGHDVQIFTRSYLYDSLRTSRE